MGPLMRRQAALHQPLTQHPPHLGQALKRRFARIGDLPLIGGGGEIAMRQPAIIMRGADQTVEVDLCCFRHPGHRSGPRYTHGSLPRMQGVEPVRSGDKSCGLERRHAQINQEHRAIMIWA